MNKRKSKLAWTLFGAFIALTLLLAPPAKAQLVRTGYTAIVSAASSQCLDVAYASTAPGASTLQWPCNFSANEEWTVKPYSAGLFQIVEQQTGYCLAVTGSSLVAGAAIVQTPCGSMPAILWSFVPSGASYEIVNKNSGQCITVSANAAASGDAIVQHPCSTAASALWSIPSGLISSTALTVAQAAHSGQCLNVSGASTAAGGPIIQWPCGTSSNNFWTFVPTGSYYEVVAGNSGLCLSNNGLVSENAPILQETCSSTKTSDLWTLAPVGGSYEIVAANSGYCVSITAASQTAAAKAVQWPCSGANYQLWSLSSSKLPASWTAVTALAVDPIGVANRPDGQLMMWSAYDPFNYEGDIGNGEGQTYTSTFNPATMTSSDVLVTATGDDMFCSGTANLFNGDVLINGGSSSPKTTIYSPVTSTWSADANMNLPRGYEGDVVLTNGSVMTLGGSWSGGYGGKSAEVWTQGEGWTELTNVPETSITGPDPAGVYRGDNHLWLFSAPNGEVFHAGPTSAMHWITTTGKGSIVSAGNRGTDAYSMNGNAELYDIGMILKTGGAPAYTGANSEPNAYVININNGTAGVTVKQVAPMAYPRAMSSSVVLPNGQVVVIGGNTYAQTFTDTDSVLTPEIYDPVTQVFRTMAPMQTPRVYHSTAILLPDGRVFVGGGGQCGQGCAANHFNTEILTPPYLLTSSGAAAVRPVISSAPADTALGDNIAVTTASPVLSFVLMRLSSITHTVNNDQRRIPLSIASAEGSSYTLQIPSNPGIVLPGYYWLFALNAQGVPSVGSTILIDN